MLMKKIFTLLAVSLLALGASAQNWFAPEVAPEPGEILVDDGMVTAKTVFATTVTEDAFTHFTGGWDYGYHNFTHRMNVRVDAWPTPDCLTGTEKSGSTPVILEAHCALHDIRFVMRRQYGNGYVACDGKDIRIFRHPDAAVMTGEMIEVNDLDGEFGNCVEAFNLPAGTYTIAAKGTTLGLFGFIYSVLIGVSDVAVDATGGEAVYYNLNGVKVANPESGLYIKVQGGKATKVIR